MPVFCQVALSELAIIRSRLLHLGVSRAQCGRCLVTSRPQEAQGPIAQVFSVLITLKPLLRLLK